MSSIDVIEERLQKYRLENKKNKDNLEGFWKHGYIITAPHFSMRAVARYSDRNLSEENNLP